MNKFEGVANTLFVPLVARINISKKFPEYFFDEKALELEQYLPEGADKGASEYSDMASVSRYYNMDKTVQEFVKRHTECNIVYLGAGLETAYDRLNEKVSRRIVHWYETDLPEVIEARKTVFGQRENETLISGDMFKLEWIKEIDKTLPTLLIVSGVFQYFHEEEIITFIKACGQAYGKAASSSAYHSGIHAAAGFCPQRKIRRGHRNRPDQPQPSAQRTASGHRTAFGNHLSG